MEGMVLVRGFLMAEGFQLPLHLPPPELELDIAPPLLPLVPPVLTSIWDIPGC